MEFQFPSATLRKVRAVETLGDNSEMWSITEFRVYSNGEELRHAPEWRLTAYPNPWDVQLAFDNSPVTRLQSWEPAKPGTYREVDFGSSRPVDRVRLECPNQNHNRTVRIEGMNSNGTWSTLADRNNPAISPMAFDLRRAAMHELKARGIRYLLVHRDDLDSEE